MIMHCVIIVIPFLFALVFIVFLNFIQLFGYAAANVLNKLSSGGLDV